MGTDRPIIIRDRVYRKNPEVKRYQIHLDELHDLRMCDIPAHSHLQVLGLPVPDGACEAEWFGLNAGDDGEIEHLRIYGGVSFRAGAGDRPRILSRLRRAFPEVDSEDEEGFRAPEIYSRRVDDGFLVGLYIGLSFKKNPEIPVRIAFTPVVDGLQSLNRPGAHVFICYASEDKSTAHSLATAIRAFGAAVWFDEWEIRVGDSIVQRVSDAIGTASHLVVLLSENSVGKPWVQKEFSAALMRQLSENSIRVLPLRLDGCLIPPLLSDLRYADARAGIANALPELEAALFLAKEPDHDW